MSKQTATISPVISEIIVPQMGEGLREVTIIRFLKNLGEKIEKDQVLYIMETDKSTFEIEALVGGHLLSWEVNEGDIVAVGARIGTIETIDTHSKVVCEPEKESMSNFPSQNDKQLLLSEDEKKIFRKIPPRTRLYCKEAGISLAEMLAIPQDGSVLLSTDVDNYLEQKNKLQNVSRTAEEDIRIYQDIYIPEQQQMLNARFKASQQNIIPATLVATIELIKLEKVAQFFREQGADLDNQKAISVFQAFAYCVAQACIKYPLFRTMLIGKSIKREFSHVNLGIAVQTHQDDLVTAVIPAADTLNFDSFIDALQTRVERALDGEDQIKLRPNIILSYMGDCGVVWGSPLLVDPAIALLFLGSPYPPELNYLHLSLTIDHRIINGIEASKFLQHIKKIIENLSGLVD